MTEEIIIDKEDKTKKHRNNEIDCLHFGCRKGENGNVLFWCDFYDDHCNNYSGCYYRKCLRLEQENKDLKKQIESDKGLITVGGKQQYEYLQRIDELKKTVENQKLEYEELQCDLSEVENACGCYQSENAELKQENKELKEVKEQLKKWNDENLKRQNDMQKWIDLAEEQRNNYRFVLEEIREMTKKYNAEVGDTIIANPIQDCYDIYSKINEALNKG